jgi:hypothetical protein
MAFRLSSPVRGAIVCSPIEAQGVQVLWVLYVFQSLSFHLDSNAAQKAL